jgi:tRNA C32,U32 (ribose-2'-O)-methylase TrmJ
MKNTAQIIQQQIKDIEYRIARDKQEIQNLNQILTKLKMQDFEVQNLNQILTKLKMQDFEEDLRNTDNMQLLKG